VQDCDFSINVNTVGRCRTVTSVNFNNEEGELKTKPRLTVSPNLTFFAQLTHVRLGVGNDLFDLSDMLNTW
jgi:hypothetical protein